MVIEVNGKTDKPADAVGTITIAITADGKWGWKPDGQVPAGPAVNALMVVMQSYIGIQVQQQLQAAMKQQQSRVCLPDGTIPVPKI